MDPKTRRKVRALYVFEAAIFAYLAGTAIAAGDRRVLPELGLHELPTRGDVMARGSLPARRHLRAGRWASSSSGTTSSAAPDRSRRCPRPTNPHRRLHRVVFVLAAALPGDPGDRRRAVRALRPRLSRLSAGRPPGDLPGALQHHLPGRRPGVSLSLSALLPGLHARAWSPGEQGARLRARDATAPPLRRPRLARDDRHRRSASGGRSEPGRAGHE